MKIHKVEQDERVRLTVCLKTSRGNEEMKTSTNWSDVTCIHCLKHDDAPKYASERIKQLRELSNVERGKLKNRKAPKKLVENILAQLKKLKNNWTLEAICTESGVNANCIRKMQESKSASCYQAGRLAIFLAGITGSMPELILENKNDL
jgi:hypothetical protein